MMFRSRCTTFLILLLTVAFANPPAHAGDWPMWRYDTGRSAASPEELPDRLHLQWVRECPPLDRAWPNAKRLRFDLSYEPIVLGKRMFLTSSRNDSVTALATETGEEQWRFYADGPIRFAPAGWKDKVYVGSDDGFLYCLDAETGKLVWKFAAAPRERRVLGNGRLISSWPVRGAPVVADGKVYLAASIWPFMGVFIYCLDAETGDVVWVNEGLGSIYILQPHTSPAFAGPAPQGYLAVQDDKLIVPSGRSTPAVLNRHTGELVHYRHAQNKDKGGYHVAAASKYYTNAGLLYDLESGLELNRIGVRRKGTDEFGGRDTYPVMTSETIFESDDYRVRAWDLTKAKLVKSKKYTLLRIPRSWDSGAKRLREIKDPGKGIHWVIFESPRLHIRAGNRLCLSVSEMVKTGEDHKPSGKVEPPRVAPGDKVLMMSLPKADGKPETVWEAKVDGDVWTMLAADGKLFVVTYGAKIYCFGAKAGEPKTHKTVVRVEDKKEEWTARAGALLKNGGIDEGYALCLGIGSGRLIEEVARQSKLHVIGVDADESRVAGLRKRLDAAGLYGHRVALIAADPSDVSLPPYFARLVFSENPKTAGFATNAALVKKAYECLRPYGGRACLGLSGSQHKTLAKVVADAKLPKAKVDRQGGLTTLTREGALPGSADWTHQYADAANTNVSKDDRVKAPLGVLWWSASHNDSVLPRHGHGPTEQVTSGKLIIEGPDSLQARDIYTGVVLWERELPGVGKHYDYTSHEAGANAVGSNFVSLPDGIYVAYGRRCLRLDPATGQTMSQILLPPWGNRKAPPNWGTFRIYKDLIVAAALPITFSSDPIGEKENFNAISSKRLDVVDRHTGKHLWSAVADYSFRHNAICAGGGKIFCMDRFPLHEVAMRKRRGETPKGKAKILAFDAKTGKEIWRTDKDIFGTWLSYSEEHDLLLQAARHSRDMVSDEPRGRMIAYRGKDGTVLWDIPDGYDGPCMLHGDKIITQGDGVVMRTGKTLMRKDPLTGLDMPWKFTRNYGCNTAIASQHLLTFRSAAAGYFDLAGMSGTGNFGGFRSSCTSNLIVAGGLLNAPDYTRTCTCSYQNQSSLALIPMPKAEVWAFNHYEPKAGARIRRVGINLGAPGDRMASNGTLWLEYPKNPSPSPDVRVELDPSEPGTFCRHSLRVEGESHAWVGASGVRGLRSATLGLLPKTKQTDSGDRPAATTEAYTVRLYFCEPEEIEAGARVFDVSLQGKRVLKGFDVVKAAGGAMRVVVREFKGIGVEHDLSIALSPVKGTKMAEPILCGVEAVIESAAVASGGE